MSDENIFKFHDAADENHETADEFHDAEFEDCVMEFEDHVTEFKDDGAEFKDHETGDEDFLAKGEARLSFDAAFRFTCPSRSKKRV